MAPTYTGVADANGDWSINVTTPLALGEHTVRARQSRNGIHFSEWSDTFGMEVVPMSDVIVDYITSNGFDGGVYDVSEAGALWQDRARTTPATDAAHPVGSIDDLSGNGRHLLTIQTGTITSTLTEDEVGMLEVDAPNGSGLWIEAGKFVSTGADLPVMAPPCYVAVCLTRKETLNKEVFRLGKTGAQIVFANTASVHRAGQDATRCLMSASTDAGTVSHEPRIGMFPEGVPFVLDGYLDGSTFTRWHNGGSTPITFTGAQFAGGPISKDLAWTTPVASGRWGINLNSSGDIASHTTGHTGFRAGVVIMGAVSDEMRAYIHRWLMQKAGLTDLLAYEQDTILFLGCSQGQGVGDNRLSNAPPRGVGSQYVDDGSIGFMKDPIQHMVPGDASLTGSMGPPMAKRIWDVCGRRTHIVGACSSGDDLLTTEVVPEGNKNWSPTGILPGLAVARLNASRTLLSASPGAPLRAVCYIDGTNDASYLNSGSTTPAAYADLVEDMWDNILSLITANGHPAVPLFLVKPEDRVDGLNAVGYAAIRTAYDLLIARRSDVLLGVDFQDMAATRPDDFADTVHYNYPILNDKGSDLADSICANLGWV